MSTRTIINCDECGIERTAENHWFSVVKNHEQPQFVPYEEFNMALHAIRVFDLCGRECAQKVLERWLDIGSVLKPEGDAR